jgi:glycerol-3-phosphate acyltransferase PlsX
MGGDHAPAEIVAGALLARKELGIEIALVGPKEIIEEELAHHGPPPSGIEIVHASEAIAMDEHPAQAVRTKRDASINVAMGMVKRGVASAFVSAGNTGAIMASALMTLGRIQGIERPALGTVAPSGPDILVLAWSQRRRQAELHGAFAQMGLRGTRHGHPNPCAPSTSVAKRRRAAS